MLRLLSCNGDLIFQKITVSKCNDWEKTKFETGK